MELYIKKYLFTGTIVSLILSTGILFTPQVHAASPKLVINNTSNTDINICVDGTFDPLLYTGA